MYIYDVFGNEVIVILYCVECCKVDCINFKWVLLLVSLVLICNIWFDRFVVVSDVKFVDYFLYLFLLIYI